MPGVWQHLDEVTDLEVGSELLRAAYEFDRDSRELGHHSFNRGKNFVVGIGNTKDDFKCGIVLRRVTAQTRVRVRVHAAKRLQYGNRRCKSGVHLLAIPRAE